MTTATDRINQAAATYDHGVDASHVLARTRCYEEWDGFFTAACPRCGRDVAWHAHPGRQAPKPICSCGTRRRKR